MIPHDLLEPSLLEDKVTESEKDSFYFTGIKKIKFRALDTNGFLNSDNLKPQQLIDPSCKRASKK
jgi:hypothetical protein